MIYPDDVTEEELMHCPEEDLQEMTRQLTQKEYEDLLRRRRESRR